MTLYTSDSKVVIETISYYGDFRDVLVPGETITSHTVTVTVFSGDDPSPSSLLYGGTIVHPGWIEQRIRLGIPGTIYSIQFNVVTSKGNTYDKVTRLAILPQIGGAVPVFTSIYETTIPYPYELQESIKSQIFVTSGHLVPAPYMLESVQSYIGVTGGTLVVYGPKYYTMPPEAVQNSIALVSGTLVQYYELSYTIPSESIKNAIAIISGTLVVYTPISYNMPGEGISNGISISSGVLGS